MHNASGHHRDESSWPLPPLAVPRGVKEWLWHAAAFAAVLTPLVLPGGIVVFGAAIAMTWLFDVPVKNLIHFGLEYLAVGFAIAIIFATPGTFLSTMVHIFIWRRAHAVGMPLAFTLGYLFEWTISVFAVATLLNFDRRSVSRTTVDLRVWQRQQTRRRQLLRHWHNQWEIPEVSR